jgi:hypothetical protein
MAYLALMGLVALISVLNLATGFVEWLVSPYGLASAFIAANLGLCAFASSCPPVALLSKLCASAGCGSSGTR